MKRSWVLVSIAVIIVIVFGGLAGYFLLVQRAEPASLTKVSAMSPAGPSANYFWPVFAGQQAGIYAKYGLSVSYDPFIGDNPMFQAMSGGTDAVGMDPVVGVIRARSLGVPVSCIAVYIPTNTFWQIYVTANSSVTDVRQLNNTKIGVSDLGGADQFYFQMVAQKFKLNVQYIAGGSLPSRVALARTGQISAFPTTNVQAFNLLKAHQLRAIYTMADAEPSNWQDGYCLFTSDSFAQRNPTLLKKVVAAFLESVQYIVDHEDVAVQIYMKQTNATQASGAELYKFYQWQASGKIDTAAFRNMEYAMAGLHFIQQVPPATDLYKTEFLP